MSRYDERIPIPPKNGKRTMGGGVLTPKNPKKTQSQFTDFGVATGIFWDFLGFLGFFGFFLA